MQKPCPFCGRHLHLDTANEVIHWWRHPWVGRDEVQCPAFGFKSIEEWPERDEAAIAAWNLRSPPTEDADRVEVWGSSIIDRLQRAIMDDDEAVRERAAENVAVLYAHSVAPYAAALAMVRETIGELFGPKASIESEDATLLRGPEPHHEAEAQIAALRRVSASPRPETVGALRPFADIADLIDSETEGLCDTDECQLVFHDYLMANFTVAQFRRARSALNATPQDGK